MTRPRIGKGCAGKTWGFGKRLLLDAELPGAVATASFDGSPGRGIRSGELDEEEAGFITLLAAMVVAVAV
jgi:hypothetical protein